MLIMTTMDLNITLDQFFFYSIYTSARNLVSVSFVCGFKKVDFCACLR